MVNIAIDQDRDVLLIIDVQQTFMPGGGLAVAGGDAVLAPVNALLAERFTHAVATQDWHPRDHSSFASAHAGKKPFETIMTPYGEQTLWPDHGVQGTEDAALHPALRQDRIELILRKGFRREIDSYSAFFENDRKTTTGLDGYFRARGFARVFLAGIATDFCVAYSAEDAVRLGYPVFIIEDACRGIGMPLGDGRTTLDAEREKLTALGVKFVSSTELVASGHSASLQPPA